MLGEPLHGHFENYASDENLPARPLVLGPRASGGIFVEHGVHFFDLFAGWLGPGRVEAAQVGLRPGTAIEEHVHSTVRYGETALVDFYHGFHQPGRMDRQELRLVFERGDVTLHEWVPTRGRVLAIVDEKGTRDLCELFPRARLDVAAALSPKDRSCQGRHQATRRLADGRAHLRRGAEQGPPVRRLLRAMMADQVAWVRDRSHRRRVTEENGRDSLAVAVEADRLAHAGGPSMIRSPGRGGPPAPGGPPPSREDFEVVGAFNPGAAASGRRGRPAGPRGGTADRNVATGFTPLPRWEPGEGAVVDWVPDEELEPIDPRVVRRKADGLIRLNFLSHLRVVRCGDGRSAKDVDAIGFWPESPMEEFGVEDPRITAIGDRFWITYVAVSRHGAATALASTTDFRAFDRHGVIFCVENKDVVLFPEPVGGGYAAPAPSQRGDAIHPARDVAGEVARPDPLGRSRAALVGAAGRGRPAGSAPARRRSGRPTGGWPSTTATAIRPAPARSGPTPPARCCSTRRTPPASCSGPRRRSSPRSSTSSASGFVPDVVFPTGIVELGDTLLVYYGAADACTAVVEFSRAELLDALR